MDGGRGVCCLEAEGNLGDEYTYKEDQNDKALMVWMCFLIWHFATRWDLYHGPVPISNHN